MSFTKLVGVQAVAIGQRAMRGRNPEAVMEGLGFGELQLVDSFSVSMSGLLSL